MTIQPDADNTIYQGKDENTCGAGPHIVAGETKNGVFRRAPIRFDIAGNIPANATINSVTLTLNLNKTEDDQSSPMTLHRLTRDWGEGSVNCGTNEAGKGAPANPGDATWNFAKFNQIAWTTSGGDYISTASATAVVGQNNGDKTWNSAAGGNGGMATDVQGWLDGVNANYGWMLVGEEDRNPGQEVKTARRFASSENNNAGNRPELTIDFDPPAASFACCFTEGDCQVLTQTACNIAGGTPDLNNTSCTPNMCPQPIGACCNTDESCVDPVSRETCESGGGVFQGSGSFCGSPAFDCGLEPFVDALPIPGVLAPVGTRPDGVPQYEITVQTAQQQLHSELPLTDLWTYNGSYPASTIEARVGDPIEVKYINDLPPGGHLFEVDECAHGPNYYSNASRIVTHLHGGHVPARFDGGPEFTLLPGEMDIYQYPNNQEPATMWYHDHALGITRLNVYGGMAGFYLLRDDIEDGLGLPAGEFEVPLVVQDRQINPDGSLFYPAGFVNAFFSDKILVNGKVWPRLDVKKGKYRFRILNGSQARTYALRLENLASPSDVIPFTLIGTDLGLISAPINIDTIEMTSAERFDVIVDFSSFPTGTEIVLRNDDMTIPAVPNVMKFVVTGDIGFTGPIPATLRTVTPILEAEADRTRWFRLLKGTEPCSGNQWLIQTLDGPGGNPTGDELWDDISEFVQLGDTEIWEFENPSAAMHPMHIHLVAFQVLDRENLTTGAPLPLEAHEANTWKDTVRVDPDTKVRVIARFEDYMGRFSYHCHILDHEDHEMMRQFQMTNAPANCDSDGFCEAGEDAVSCPLDCNEVSGALCGNGLCEIGDGEDCTTCPSDCNGVQTGGDQFCCGNGGTNPIACGTDDLDTRCIDADFDRFCRIMPRLVATCGDHLCEGAETASSCPQDCLVPFCEATEVTNETSCGDAIDNDCDGNIDAADTDCPQADADGDGAPDSFDNCLFVDNGYAQPDSGGNNQLDTDGDGIGNACDADLDNNCFVNFADLSLFGDEFGVSGNSIADFDGSGFVNFADLSIFSPQFGMAPGPSGVPNVCSTP